MDVARGHALAERDRGDREISRCQISGDVSFDRLKSRCAHAADIGDAAASCVAPNANAIKS